MSDKLAINLGNPEEEIENLKADLMAGKKPQKLSFNPSVNLLEDKNRKVFDRKMQRKTNYTGLSEKDKKIRWRFILL